MTLLAVLGMHRSGTSVVAGMLQALGWDVGPAELLMPAKPDNPRGFVEHLPAVQVNDRLLYRLGGSWREPPALGPGWEDDADLDDLRDEARQVARRLRSGPRERVLFKDPRLSVTLPFWRTVTTIDDVVLVLRPPDPVVRSLTTREDDMDVDEAAWLYVDHLLAAVREDPLHLVDPGDLLADPASVGGLARALGHEPTDAELDAAAATVDPSLWGRSSRTDSDLDETPGLRLARLAHQLVAGTDGADWRAALGGLAPRRGIAARTARLTEQRDRYREERDTWHELHDRMRDHRDTVVAQLASRDEQLATLRAERDAARSAPRPEEPHG